VESSNNLNQFGIDKIQQQREGWNILGFGQEREKSKRNFPKSRIMEGGEKLFL
jgi:hypothetical protein